MNEQEHKVKGWIAKDEDGSVLFHYLKPQRSIDGYWYSSAFPEPMEICYIQFPYLTWESEPIEVEFIIRYEKTGEMNIDKQKAEEIASKVIAIDQPITYSTLTNALMMMAQWKDRELLRVLQSKVKELSNNLLSKDYTMCP